MKTLSLALSLVALSTSVALSNVAATPTYDGPVNSVCMALKPSRAKISDAVDLAFHDRGTAFRRLDEIHELAAVRDQLTKIVEQFIAGREASGIMMSEDIKDALKLSDDLYDEYFSGEYPEAVSEMQGLLIEETQRIVKGLAFFVPVDEAAYAKIITAKNTPAVMMAGSPMGPGFPCQSLSPSVPVWDLRTKIAIDAHDIADDGLHLNADELVGDNKLLKRLSKRVYGDTLEFLDRLLANGVSIWESDKGAPVSPERDLSDMIHALLTPVEFVRRNEHEWVVTIQRRGRDNDEIFADIARRAAAIDNALALIDRSVGGIAVIPSEAATLRLLVTINDYR
jgi:hypothetical protein